MSRVLIKELDLWSVARTVFPLFWIISALLVIAGYLLIGSIIGNLLAEYTGHGWGIYGLALIILASILVGFFSAIGLTLVAVAMALAYNFLSSLGGGVTVTLAELEGAAEAAGERAQPKTGTEAADTAT
ncbi:MAG: DUF3566 domain-containing protein [Candidatus Marinimicrobia bacterium]|nr:DUF3566 domain-containing protein [Candidatus Neomarinimicrobiota bacterium]